MLSRLCYIQRALFLYISRQCVASGMVVGLSHTAYVALLIAEEFLCATKFAIRKNERIYVL